MLSLSARRRNNRPPPQAPLPPLGQAYVDEVNQAFNHAQAHPTRHKYKMGDYSCHLALMRCAGINKNGTRCRRTSFYGMPMCWAHLMQTYHVRLGKTSIPGMHFNGLFACGPETTVNRVTGVFHKGDVILPYIGQQFDVAESARIHDLADEEWRKTRPRGDGIIPYGLEQRNGHLVDAACVRSAAAFANTFGPGQRPDAEFKEGVPFARIVALKAIPNGKEIFIRYARNMSQAVRSQPPNYHRTNPEPRPQMKPETCARRH